MDSFVVSLPIRGVSDPGGFGTLEEVRVNHALIHIESLFLVPFQHSLQELDSVPGNSWEQVQKRSFVSSFRNRTGRVFRKDLRFNFQTRGS
jgi:hypothetical protein